MEIHQNKAETSVVGKHLNWFSSLYKLDPIMDDGVLRVGERLNKSEMPEETKRPIILPKDLHISTLILQHIVTDKTLLGLIFVL